MYGCDRAKSLTVAKGEAAKQFIQLTGYYGTDMLEEILDISDLVNWELMFMCV